jgi:hypothetical protein
VLGVALLATACATGRVEDGVFYSVKGYQVRLPAAGWRAEAGGRADLELRREAPPGGMLVDASCEGRDLQRAPRHLVRHLTFGLARRETLEDGRLTVGGREGARRVLRGVADGVEVGVEAVVLRGARCVYDFLYVAPVGHFEAGRADFKALVESLAGEDR